MFGPDLLSTPRDHASLGLRTRGELASEGGPKAQHTRHVSHVSYEGSLFLQDTSQRLRPLAVPSFRTGTEGGECG